MQTITIKEVGSRADLIEGRCDGMAFAFCRKVGEGSFETVNALSTCKDFLNDQLYSEQSGKPYTRWGYKATKVGCLDGALYLAVTMLPNKHSKIPDQTLNLKALMGNIPHIQAGLNTIEERLKQDGRTKLHAVGESLVLVEAPLFWGSSTYALSMMTLLLRCLLLYDGSTSLDDFLKKPQGRYDDESYLRTALSKLDIMSKAGLPKQTFTEAIDYHNAGIVSWKPS